MQTGQKITLLDGILHMKASWEEIDSVTIRNCWVKSGLKMGPHERPAHTSQITAVPSELPMNQKQWEDFVKADDDLEVAHVLDQDEIGSFHSNMNVWLKNENPHLYKMFHFYCGVALSKMKVIGFGATFPSLTVFEISPFECTTIGARERICENIFYCIFLPPYPILTKKNVVSYILKAVDFKNNIKIKVES